MIGFKRMENYTNNKDTYIQRMNQTAKSKFAVIEPYLSKGMKILDFGSGISPEFISDIDSTGAEYYAYDISKTVQTELARMGVNVVTKDDLTNKEVQFDIIYLSSVFHEIISYLNRQERTETITMIMESLKPGGFLIIRDWANPNDTDLLFCIETVSKQAEKEMDIWVNELLKNSIIDNDYSKYEDGSIVTHSKNAYEILFHTVWGLKSLNRESKEQYNIKDSIMNWIYYPWKKSLELKTDYQEKDETYLPHLQKYFDMSSIPFNTKSIYIFQKMNKTY
jgi:methyltransferase domain